MKILYSTDGFEPAEQAAGLLARVADPDRVEISVVSVTPAGLPDLGYAPLMLDPIDVRRKNTLALVDHWVEWFRAKGFRADAHVAEGKAGEEIVKLVRHNLYDLAVVGSGRRTWLGRTVLGSVSTHVLHSSPTSVLVVHGSGGSEGEPRVLVAVDGSRSCEFAARGVMDLVPSSTRIRVVSCFEPALPFATPGAATVVRITSGDLYEQAREAATRLAEGIAVEFRDHGYEVEAVPVAGHPLERILAEGEAFRADLIAMGSRGLGPVGRTLLGSVSDHVVRHAPATLVGRHLVEEEES